MPLATSIGLYGMAFGPLGMREVVHRLLSYHGSTGFCWGYVATIHPCWIRPARLSPHAWIVPLSSKILLVGLLLAGLLLLWRRRPLEGMVAFPLIFYLFSPGWGPNYSIWVLPFALLLSVRLGIGYTLIMLSPVGLIYFDSLYAAYPHSVFSWTVLKPVEAALGLAGWCGVAAMVVYLYLSGERPAPTHRRPPPLDEAWHIRRAALE